MTDVETDEATIDLLATAMWVSQEPESDPHDPERARRMAGRYQEWAEGAVRALSGRGLVLTISKKGELA